MSNAQEQLWKDMQPILKNHPNGIEVQALYKQLNSHKYDSQFVCKFIDSMHKDHRLIAYVSSNPPMITMRRGKDANHLKKLTLEQYTVYNQIEKSRSEGIIMTHLSNKANMSSQKCKYIVTKVLEKRSLTSKFTNSRTFQVFYYATSFKPPQVSNEGTFHGPKGTIDQEWLHDITTVIQHKIKTSDSIHGISALELQQFIKESGLTKDNKGLPINDIDVIIQLLLYENKIDLIPSTIPNHELDEYLTHSKNTFYHLIQGIQHKRTVQMDKMHADERKKKRKLKLNPQSIKKRKLDEKRHTRITYDLIDEKPMRTRENNGQFIWSEDKSAYVKECAKEEEEKEVDPVMENIRKYGDIKFRYNKYEYASPVSQIPCQSCPVASTCSDDGVINPIDCPYLNAWLNLF
eukprot:30703_1